MAFLWLCCGLDVVVFSAGGFEVFHFSGKVQLKSETMGGPALTSGAVLDVDGDGLYDLVTSGRKQTKNIIWKQTQPYQFEIAQRMPSYETWKVKTVDVDGDGDKDLFFVNAFDYDQAVPLANQIWLNDHGRFSPSLIEFKPQFSMDAQVADFDEDGRQDLVVANRGKSELLLNKNDTFELFFEFPDAKSNGVTVADFDGDQHLDIAFANEKRVHIFRNNFFEAGTFQLIEEIKVDSGFAIQAGDLNADGLMDLALAQIHHHPNQIFLNSRQGFKALGSGFDTWYSLGLTLVDVDEDGDLDLISANRHTSRENGLGPNKLWLNQGLGNFVDSYVTFGEGRSRTIVTVNR